MKLRIGQGIDFHQLEPNIRLRLGNIHIPSDKGCVAHSDGDVLIHAICDALLGAAGLKDIGHHFPDSSSEYKDIDSGILLKKTIALIRDKNYVPVNIDCTICLEKPKIAPYVDQMRESLSRLTDMEIDSISIKATTTEKMGSIGRGEGIAAFAVVLLSNNI